MTEARVTTLASGLRVVSADMPGLESAAVGAWVNAGARCEPVELNGVSHLLEHMAFKGTRRRSALAIAEEIESVGGHLNAYTSREQTAYIARVLKADIPLAVPHDYDRTAWAAAMPPMLAHHLPATLPR